MNNINLITYTDEDGLLQSFHSPDTKIFRDKTFYCPGCHEHCLLAPKHRRALAWHIDTAEYKTYRPEVCR